MIRLETIVCLVVATVSSLSWAKKEDSDATDRAGISKAYHDSYVAKDCYNKSKANDPECLDLKALREASAGGAPGECNDVPGLKEKAELAAKQFKTACGGAGLTIDDSNGVACSKALDKCLGGGMGGDGPSEDGVNHSRMSAQARECPAMVGKDAKDLEKRAEAAKKDKDAAEEKAAKSQEKMMEARNKALDDQGKAAETRAKAEQKLDDDLAEAEKKYLDSKKTIAAEIVQLQQQIATADDQIRQMFLMKTDAEMEYNEAIKAIEMNCHKSASDTVSAYQKDRLSRPLNRGNFGTMLKQVGLSDRESWQRLAEKYYRYCTSSKPTKVSKTTAKARYDAALRKANAQIQKAEEQKQALIKQQNDKKNGVCDTTAPTQISPSAPEESDACVAAKTAMSDSQRATRKANSEANKAAQEEARAAQKGQAAEMAAFSEGGKAGQRAADEEKRMRTLRRAYEIANEADSRTNGDPKAHEKATEKYDELSTIAAKYTSCMNKKCVGDTLCERLQKLTRATGTTTSFDTTPPDPAPVSADAIISKAGKRTPALYDRSGDDVMKTFDPRFIDSTGAR